MIPDASISSTSDKNIVNTNPDIVESQIEELGAKIRLQKLSLSKSGLSKADINAQLKDSIEELKRLKKLLPVDSALSQAKFEQKKKQEDREKSDDKKKEKHRCKQRRENKMAVLRDGKLPLCQRKTLHLLSYAGNGQNFRYISPDENGFGLNAKDLDVSGSGCDLSITPDSNLPLYLTQKWDGTTCQATCQAVFKRLDTRGSIKGRKNRSKNGGKGKGNHHISEGSAIAASRYDLYLVCWFDVETGRWEGLHDPDNLGSKQLRDCIDPYLDRFRDNLPDGLCCYFEAVHREINVRYRHLDAYLNRSESEVEDHSESALIPHIRVFDFSRSTPESDLMDLPDTFIKSILEIEGLSLKYNLPFVGYATLEKAISPRWTPHQVYLSLLNLCATGPGPAEKSKHILSSPGNLNCIDPLKSLNAPLEGFVLRQDNGFISKVRIECALN